MEGLVGCVGWYDRFPSHALRGQGLPLLQQTPPKSDHATLYCQRAVQANSCLPLFLWADSSSQPLLCLCCGSAKF